MSEIIVINQEKLNELIDEIVNKKLKEHYNNILYPKHDTAEPMLEMPADDKPVEPQENKKVCITCGSSENKFRNVGKRCIKCYSKSNNIKSKEKGYHKKYYLEHEGKNHKQRNKEVNVIEIYSNA